MKLFSEYYAGHINHNFHLFGKDDIEFLQQFPKKQWQKAMVQRYCVDLPKALKARDEARRKPLAKLKDDNGNPIKKNYYDLIEETRKQIYDRLTYKGRNAQEKAKISDSTYDNAKNIVDSRIAEIDPDGAWMGVNYPRTTYNFPKSEPIVIQNNYIAELVKRIEGPKGTSPVGFDLSNLKNFDESIDDNNQRGRWYTDGFTCPEADRIIDNMQAWVGFSSQALLNEPGSIPNQEKHRTRPKERYVIGSEAKEAIDETIYKKPLQNKYSRFINSMKREFRENETVDPAQLNILRQKFNLMNTDTDSYSYRRALKGRFPDYLEELLGTRNAETLSDNQLIAMIEALVNVHNPFERHLINALTDIDLLTYKPQNYHGTVVDVESNPYLMHRTIQSPNFEKEKIPELHPGKVLVSIDNAKKSIESAIKDAEERGDDEELDRLNTILADLNARRRVGHHFNPLELERGRLKRGPIFYQFADDRDVPVDIDTRHKIVAGGIQPNKAFVQDKGPGHSDIANSLNQLVPYFDDERYFDDFLKNFIRDNYQGNYNILFKTFISPQQAITSQSTYNLFKKLIKDRAFRNLSMFDLTEVEARNYRRSMNTKMRVLVKQICQRLIEKEVGESGTVRGRQGEISDAASVEARMHEMIGKTMR